MIQNDSDDSKRIRLFLKSPESRFIDWAPSEIFAVAELRSSRVWSDAAAKQPAQQNGDLLNCRTGSSSPSVRPVNWQSRRNIQKEPPSSSAILDEAEFRTSRSKTIQRGPSTERVCKEMKRNKHPKSTDTASNESKENDTSCIREICKLFAAL